LIKINLNLIFIWLNLIEENFKYFFFLENITFINKDKVKPILTTTLLKRKKKTINRNNK